MYVAGGNHKEEVQRGTQRILSLKLIDLILAPASANAIDIRQVEYFSTWRIRMYFIKFKGIYRHSSGEAKFSSNKYFLPRPRYLILFTRAQLNDKNPLNP